MREREREQSPFLEENVRQIIKLYKIRWVEKYFFKKCIVLNTKLSKSCYGSFFLQLKFLSSKINYLNFSFSKEDYYDNQTSLQIYNWYYSNNL